MLDSCFYFVSSFYPGTVWRVPRSKANGLIRLPIDDFSEYVMLELTEVDGGDPFVARVVEHDGSMKDLEPFLAELVIGNYIELSYDPAEGWDRIVEVLEAVREVNGIFFVMFGKKAFERFNADGFSELKALLREETANMIWIYEGECAIQLLRHGRCPH